MTALSRVVTWLCCFVFLLVIVSCGIKNNPVPPERIIIPQIQTLSATLQDSTVTLSWTPSLQYADGSDLDLRSTEVWLLEEDLSQRLTDLLEAREEQRLDRERAGIDLPEDPNTSAPGPIRTRLSDLRRITVENLLRKGNRIAAIPVEQMIDAADGGRIWYSHTISINPQPDLDSRFVFAVREIDAEGRAGPPSNKVQIYNLETPAGPESLTYSLTQTRFDLIWLPPQRSGDLLNAALVGYNVYSGESGPPSPAPINAAPIPPATPLEWSGYGLISFSRLKTADIASALHLVTNAEMEKSGVMQTIWSPDEIQGKEQMNITVSVTMQSLGNTSQGSIILDASRDPAIETSISEGADIFPNEADNPLIDVHKVAIDTEPRTYEFETSVPVGAIAYFIRIEPRDKSTIAAPFLISHVSVMDEAGEELIDNGDFSMATTASYVLTEIPWGVKRSYSVGAIYELGGQTLKADSPETVQVTFADTFAPDPPSRVNAQPSFESITITWNQSRSSDVRGYLVYRRSESDTRWRRLGSGPVQGGVYRDTEVEAATTYEYRVEAIDTSGNESTTSATVTAKIVDR